MVADTLANKTVTRDEEPLNRLLCYWGIGTLRRRVLAIENVFAELPRTERTPWLRRILVLSILEEIEHATAA